MTSTSVAPVADDGPAADLVSLPELSIAIGVGLDRIRRAARAGCLVSYLVKCGPVRCVRTRDLPAVRALLAPHLPE